MNDIRKLTAIACSYFKKYGQDKYIRDHKSIQSEISIWSIDDSKKEDELVEKLIKEQRERANSLLIENWNLFIELIEKLKNNNEINPEEFVQMCRNHNTEISVLDAAIPIFHNYSEILKEKIGTKKEMEKRKY
jgi:ATP-dependent Zn protease